MSVADVIYNHVVKAKTKSPKIKTIEVDYEENVIEILNKYVYKTSKNVFKSRIEKEEAEKKAKFNSVILKPYFIKETKKREKELENTLTATYLVIQQEALEETCYQRIK